MSIQPRIYVHQLNVLHTIRLPEPRGSLVVSLDIITDSVTVIILVDRRVTIPYLLDITYPVVSRICFPHIAHKPFLYAQPVRKGIIKE